MSNKNKWREENPDKMRMYRATHRKKYPWLYHYYIAFARCNNPKHNRYKYYGERGIKMSLTKEDFKMLWYRDNANKLTRPSIDRKDRDGNYEIDNCEFVELSYNAVKEKCVAVVQKTLQGDIVATHPSQQVAGKRTGVGQGRISMCSRGLLEEAGGFKWEVA